MKLWWRFLRWCCPPRPRSRAAIMVRRVYYDDPDIDHLTPTVVVTRRVYTRRLRPRFIMCDVQSMWVDLGRCRTTGTMATAGATTACGAPTMVPAATTAAASTASAAPTMDPAATMGFGGLPTGERPYLRAPTRSRLRPRITQPRRGEAFSWPVAWRLASPPAAARSAPYPTG